VCSPTLDALPSWSTENDEWYGSLTPYNYYENCINVKIKCLHFCRLLHVPYTTVINPHDDTTTLKLFDWDIRTTLLMRRKTTDIVIAFSRDWPTWLYCWCYWRVSNRDRKYGHWSYCYSLKRKLCPTIKPFSFSRLRAHKMLCNAMKLRLNESCNLFLYNNIMHRRESSLQVW
jgi:hypothetical protein